MSTKITFQLPEEFKNANVTFSKNIPVHLNFNNTVENFVGTANVNVSDQTVEVSLNHFEFSFGGIIKNKEGEVITDFFLNSISLIPKKK